MIGRTNTGGGGVGGLNFQVIGGTTAPNNPKENTIWVNTSTKITGWVFSATQPTGATGMVWISVGTSSPIEFNALKKNGIQVYPLKAQQYVGGAWVDKTAKSYQGGKWADWWNGVALEPNNQYSAFTGGWMADARLTPWKDSSRADRAPTISHGTSSISISLPAAVQQQGFTDTGYKGCYRTAKMVDLTDFDSLKFDFGAVTSGGAVMVGCINKLDVALSGNAAAQMRVDAFSGGTKSLDVSALNGEYYIAITMCVYGNSANPTTVNVKKVYLE